MISLVFFHEGCFVLTAQMGLWSALRIFQVPFSWKMMRPGSLVSQTYHSYTDSLSPATDLTLLIPKTQSFQFRVALTSMHFNISHDRIPRKLNKLLKDENSNFKELSSSTYLCYESICKLYIKQFVLRNRHPSFLRCSMLHWNECLLPNHCRQLSLIMMRSLHQVYSSNPF